jgi:hypothetical protein
MKKAEEYLEEIENYILHEYDAQIVIPMIQQAFKQAQIDAIEETVKRCSQKARVETEFISSGDYSGYDLIKVDKQSILKVAEQMKGEL